MFILSDHNSIANQFIAELRDEVIQKDRWRFRNNLEKLGEILAYELSKSFSFKEKEVNSPLAKVSIPLITDQPVIVAVLRASLPFYQGFLNYFNEADSAFIGAFREESEKSEIKVNLGYQAAPNLEGREIIIADPMLATGKSILKSIETLLSHGKPKKIHIAAIFAAPEGIQYLKDHLSIPCDFWIGSLEDHLNAQFYIVPGLGDAGDLAFGPKL